MAIKIYIANFDRCLIIPMEVFIEFWIQHLVRVTNSHLTNVFYISLDAIQKCRFKANNTQGVRANASSDKLFRALYFYFELVLALPNLSKNSKNSKKKERLW